MIEIHVHHHYDSPRDAAALRRIEELITLLGAKMEQVTQDVVDAVNAMAAAVLPLPAAVDSLEAAVTAALARNPGMAQEDKDALGAAVANLRSQVKTVSDSVTDATDGIDEAASTGTTTEQPTT